MRVSTAKPMKFGAMNDQPVSVLRSRNDPRRLVGGATVDMGSP
jgi:hypothetical protein